MSRDVDAFLAALRADLQSPLPGRAAQGQMAPQLAAGPPRQEEPRDDARRGAVLVLFYLHDDRLWLPCILRATYNGVHSGQIGFPGGGQEPDDATLIDTALRETYEEIGVLPESVQVLGQLSTVYIAPSNFLVQPVVGYTPARPDFHTDPYEVADLIEIQVMELLDPANRRRETRPLHDRRLADVPFFGVHDHIIWGATAMILGELLALPALDALAQSDTVRGRPNAEGNLGHPRVEDMHDAHGQAENDPRRNQLNASHAQTGKR